MSDDWVRERAKAVCRELDPIFERGYERTVEEAIAAFGQEAIKYGRALQAADDGELAKRMFREGRERGQQDIRERLRDPDMALIRWIINEMAYFDGTNAMVVAANIIRAIAATLDEKEKADG